MREDSIAKLDFFKGRIPNLFDNYLRIDHLERVQARDAIVKPLERYNLHLAPGQKPVTIEPALVETVLTQVTTGRVAVSGTGKGRLTMGGDGSAEQDRVETRSPWKRHRSSDGNAMLGPRGRFSACAVSACPAPGKLSPITSDLPPDMSLPQQRNKSPGTPRDSHDVA